ncbi:Fc.00g116170.m01.CDS01 [Cosmosporella sp. VM-42]
MQKVTAILPSWDKTKTQSKKGFDKVWGWADKLGAPVNRLSNRIGSEAFWPTTLDKESDKAARILRSFCKDGFYTEEERPSDETGPNQKQRVLKKIPEKVIQNAVGLAIFTTMRTGLWVSGAGGSGVLVARKDDGSWSPPSGILLHTAGLGFLVGVDIYDCVVVINNRKALESFTKVRATLGGEISAVAGPVGVGGVLENDGKWKQANRPVFTYLKSRGFYAGVQVDGTIIIERTDENARFYGDSVGVADILAGKVRHQPPEVKMLLETLKSAEGRTDVDTELMEELEGQPAPGDVNVDAPGDSKLFGIPEPDDPDPFGVIALNKEGLEIVEAGTGSRPSSQQFEYSPSTTSPIYSKFYRRSLDATGTRSNRESYTSTPSPGMWRSTDRPYTTSEAGTQTDELITPSTSVISGSVKNRSLVQENERNVHDEPGTVDYRQANFSPYGDMIDGSRTSEERTDQVHVLDNKYTSVNDGNIQARVPPALPPRSITRPSRPEFEEIGLSEDERKDGVKKASDVSQIGSS